MKKICGKIVKPIEKEIFNGCISIENGKIIKIEKTDEEYENYIVPGLIDSHIHIESSMLIPEKFAELALKNGTVAIVTDPHEIANVLGIEGIKFMIENSKKTPMKIFFMAPSCVPATNFETSGATINADDIENIYKEFPEVLGLAEMMNFPGVIFGDKEVMKKIEITKKYNKHIDGHAPLLKGENLKKYVEAGIETDHECSTLEEALEKLKLGMKIQIREGSAAKDFDALHSLIETHPDNIMFCTDDSHPDELIEKGEINKIVKKAIKQNHDIFNILKAGSINAINHYGLPVGKLEVNDPADFIIVNNLQDFEIIKTYIDGEEVYNKNTENQNKTNIISHNINNFNAKKITEADIKVKCNKEGTIKINTIEAFDGSLLTKKIVETANCKNGEILTDTEKDILKLVVYNRYKENSKPSVAFIKGFKLKKGAIASTVAHDSHNILAIGTSDEEIVKAINKLVELKGGLVVSNNDKTDYIQLEVAGLMTSSNGQEIAEKYLKLNKIAKELGTDFKAPFMTLAFMALLVIPEIKLSDKGLFDGNKFEFINLIVE